MMRTILAVLGAILIGPVTGYYVTYWLSYLNHRSDCMWRFGAHFGALLIGAPLGAVTFAGLGFWLGYRLDRKARPKLSDEGDEGGSP